MDSIVGRIRVITSFPHNIAHVDVLCDDGPVIVETDHTTAATVRLGDTVRVRGMLTVERGVRYLVNIEGVERVDR